MPDLNSLITSKIAFGVLIGSLVATGSTTMAAYAGALPDALQHRAHVLIGAPEPGVELADDALTGEESNDGTDADGGATGPDVTGSAAFGLCTAYTNGGLSENSTAYRAFDEVEGGIDTYCDIVIGDKSERTDNSNKTNKTEKPAKPEKVTGPRGAADEGVDEGATNEGEDDQSTQTAPDQQRTAPEKEHPATSNGNGNGGDKDR